MDYLSFIRSWYAGQMADKPVVCFITDSYPILFFSLLFRGQPQDVQFESIELKEQHAGMIMPRLHSSFLGNTTRFWFHNISELSAAQKKEWLSYCLQYNGPNFIYFALKSADIIKKRTDAIRVLIPDTIDKKQFAALAQLFNFPRPIIPAFLKMIFAQQKELSLDHACLLMYYAQLIGNDNTEFNDQWLHKIIVPESSLFTLSQEFFAKKPEKFFPLWHSLVDSYSPAFWTVYWSEQIWRAYHYVQFSRQKKLAEARKVGFRLPFTFLRKNWRLYHGIELQHAHNFIYTLDSRFKTGGGSGGFDLFYSTFFLGKFSESF